jgi:hypothetical protein
MGFGFRFSNRRAYVNDSNIDTSRACTKGAYDSTDKTEHACAEARCRRNANDRGNAPCIIDLSARKCAREDSLRSVWTGSGLQLVFVSLAPCSAMHAPELTATDCLITVTEGECEVLIAGKRSCIVRGQAALIPSGTACEVKNASLTLGAGLAIVCAPRAYPWGTDASLCV